MNKLFKWIGMALVGITITAGAGVTIANGQNSIKPVYAATAMSQITLANSTFSKVSGGDYVSYCGGMGVKKNKSITIKNASITALDTLYTNNSISKFDTFKVKINSLVNGAIGDGDVTVSLLNSAGTVITSDTYVPTGSGSNAQSMREDEVTFQDVSTQIKGVQIYFNNASSVSGWAMGNVYLNGSYSVAASGTLDSIALSGTYPTAFTVGDSFSHDGMTVTANYVDPASSSDVTTSATFTGYNMSEAGNQTVTVSYGGKSTTYDITVSAPIAVTSVSLNKTSTTIAKGSTETLTATVLPNNASNKNVTWESDDEDVATVEDGVVTGVAAGTATITAKSAANPTKTATCEVTVTAPLYEGSLAVCSWSQFKKGEAAADKTLTDTTSVSGKSLSWNISSGEYFTSGTDYYVLGDFNTNNGAYATFSAVDNYAGIVAGLEQNSLTTYNKIYALYTRNFGVVDLNKASFSWAVAKNVVTTARIMASNDGGVHWTLLASQNVTTEASGSVSWTGSTYSDGKTVEVALVVTSNSTAGATSSAPQLRNISWILNGASFNESPTWKPAKLTVTSGSDNVEVGQDLALSATKAPSFASDSTITWSSSDAEKATVNPATGVVHGEAAGSATITATTAEGATGTKAISIQAATVHVSSVELDESVLNVKQAGSATLTATVSPGDATDKSVAWSIEGDSDITVDQNGKVSVANTATVGDTATVTVTTTDGAKTATCAITVTEFEADYTLLTSVEKLHDGMKLVIANSSGSQTAGSLNTNYLSAASATVVGTGLVSDDAQEFTLRGKVGAWKFENSSGNTLGMTSGDKNKLSQNSSDAGFEDEWSITYSDSKFVVESNTYESYYLQYNAGNGARFSSYGGTMANLCFYAAESDDNVLTFIKNNMRMGDTALSSESDTGRCKESGSGYYLAAKTALSSLSAAERSAFENNTGSKYTEALKRYKAWAAACGDKAPFDGSAVLSLSSFLPGMFSETQADGNLLAIAIAGLFGLAAAGGFIVLRRRQKEDR